MGIFASKLEEVKAKKMSPCVNYEGMRGNGDITAQQ
jgi:hypothetical protein